MSWKEAIDARLIARLEAHTTRARRLARDWSMPLGVRTPRLHVEPADWRTGFLRVERERDIPVELQQDLRENLPQALLRDLYRPVHEERWVERELVDGTGDRAGVAAMQAVRDARKPPAVPRIEPIVRAVIEYQAWRRALVAERWRPLRPDPQGAQGATESKTDRSPAR
jgi:hypothetical protein